MTCENCYHNEVCKALYEMNGIPRIGASQCAYFRDKSRFVELPCKVGDTVYFVYETENETMFIDKGKIVSFSIDEDDVWFRAKYENLSSYWHTALSIGDTVFLTKEEAERDLNRKEQ